MKNAKQTQYCDLSVKYPHRPCAPKTQSTNHIRSTTVIARVSFYSQNTLCRHKTYLSIIRRGGAEKSLDRVVSWDDETRSVDEELCGNVEKDEEEVESSESEDDVDLGDRGLLLEVVEGWVFGQLVKSARAQ